MSKNKQSGRTDDGLNKESERLLLSQKGGVKEKHVNETLASNKLDIKTRLKMLKDDIANSGDEGNTDYLVHELQVHQIELEMQNIELQKSQLELEEIRDQYADLYDFSPVSYISFNDKGVVKNINITGSVLLSKPRTVIIERPFIHWLMPNQSMKFFTYLKNVFGSDNKLDEEFKIKNSHGVVLDVRMESVRRWSSSTKEYICQSVILDVTNQKKSQRELSLQARQLSLITDALPLMIAYLDINEIHQFANKPFTNWLRAADKNIIGKAANEVWSNDNYLNVKPYLDKSFAGEHVTFDMSLTNHNDDTKYINASLIPDFDNHDKVHGVILMIGDITERMALEVSDRKRLLDAAHVSRINSMGEIASEIAHELNQPLAAINIYSDACKRIVESGNYKDEKIIDTLASISKQASRAGDVIKHIREFTSKKELQLVDTDLNVLVREALNLLNVELRSGSVTLKLELAIGLPIVFVDRILIEQVILNLSRNAIEAMSASTSDVRELIIKTIKNNNREVEVIIEDSGPGLNVDEIKRIFEPFHSKKDGGMGLGLTICDTIIKAHHGRLWALPSERSGAVFCFTIPVIEEGDHNVV